MFSVTYFLDEFFDRQYHSERQVGKVVTTLAILAVIIACSGLFALSLYSVDRRAKEISIRKVFGASVSNVVVLLSRDLFSLTLIGGIVTIPLMFFAVRQWLAGYAYQMPLNEWMFIVPAACCNDARIGYHKFSNNRSRKKKSDREHEV